VYGGRYDAPVERLVRLFRVTSSATAVVLLVAVNLLPLAGVLLWDWNVYSLLILYWIENGIVGGLAIARILRAEGSVEAAGIRLNLGVTGTATKAMIVPFFVMHYGIFWLVHGVFVFALPLFIGMPDMVDPFAERFPGATPASIDIRWDAVAIGGIGLAISHGASFFLNYLGRGEYLTTSAPAQAMAPYARVVVLHMTIILGAVVSFVLGTPLGAVVILVVLKTVIDLVLHLREHRRAGARGAPALQV
jgi:hypothetical protein